MKEHPDYKYRPRRKPKTMMQKKTDAGTVATGTKPIPYSVRDLLPQHESPTAGGGGESTTIVPGTAPATTTGDQQSAAAAASVAAAAAIAVAKFPRAYFSPYHHQHQYQHQHLYPPSSFYQQVAKDLSVAAGDESVAAGKAVHELALHALYGSSLYSRAVSLATAWPMMTAAAVTTATSGGGGTTGGCPIDCAECGRRTERQPHEQSSTSSSTPSPPIRLPTLPPSPISATAVIKRPVALLVKSERATAVTATTTAAAAAAAVSGGHRPLQHVIWKPLPVLPEPAAGTPAVRQYGWPQCSSPPPPWWLQQLQQQLIMCGNENGNTEATLFPSLADQDHRPD